jgi:hypothetical protein
MRYLCYPGIIMDIIENQIECQVRPLKFVSREYQRLGSLGLYFYLGIFTHRCIHTKANWVLVQDHKKMEIVTYCNKTLIRLFIEFSRWCNSTYVFNYFDFWNSLFQIVSTVSLVGRVLSILKVLSYEKYFTVL